MLGGASEEVVFTDIRRGSELSVPSDQELVSEQQPDTTIDNMQLCSFGKIRHQLNAVSHEKYWPEVVNLELGAPSAPRLIV